MMVGYCRVSTGEQDTSLQRAAMALAGVTCIHEEKRSGGAGVDRPVLAAAVASLTAGDVLVVYKVDRLARSLIDLMSMLLDLERRGVQFKSLTEPIETTTPAGKLMVQILGAFAEFERAVIKERCTAGRKSAVSKGVQFGRRPSINLAALREFMKVPGNTRSMAAAKFGVTPNSISRALRGDRVCDVRGSEYAKGTAYTLSTADGQASGGAHL